MATSINVEFSTEHGGTGLIATVSIGRLFWPKTTTRYICHHIDPQTGGAWINEATGRSPSQSLTSKINVAALSAARLAAPPPGGSLNHLDALVALAPRSFTSRLLRWRLPSMHGPEHRQRQRDDRNAAKDRTGPGTTSTRKSPDS
ncbi:MULTISPECIES: hypothetical protein [unclassified Variovorax]|jgi:hypothetical protein|uniref:hypothetical protein n=1 Tax=unclassified Variovorax TaxID=663243 RepID=UPI003F47DFB7